MKVYRFLLYILIITMPFSIRLVGGVGGGSGERAFNVTTDEVIMALLIFVILIRSALLRVNIKLSRFDYGLFCFTILCYLSLLINEDKLTALFSFTKVWTEYIALYFIIKFFAAQDYKLNRNLIYIIMLTGVILSLNPTGDLSKSERAIGTFHNPNTYGAYMVIISCLYLSFAIINKNLRFLYITGIPILVFSILATYSRTSMVSLVLAILTILYFRTKKLLFLSLFILPFFFTTLPEKYINRLETIFTTVDGSSAGSDQSISHRYSGWYGMISSDEFREKFIIGIGKTGGIVDNQYLQILISYGIIALFIFLYIVYRMVRIIYQSFKFSDLLYTQILSLAFMGIIAMMLIQSITARTFFSPRLGGLFWGLFAILVNLVNIEIELKKEVHLEEANV